MTEGLRATGLVLARFAGTLGKRDPLPSMHVAAPEEDLLGLYLQDIGRHSLLTRDDEVRLAQMAQAGREARTELGALGGITPTRVRELRRIVQTGKAAAETFTNGNLRLVVSIARKYQTTDMALLDLVQEGNVGLMYAVEKFDWRKGFKFSTYATWWIRQSITRGIANGGRTIRLPVHARNLLHQVARSRARLEAERGRPVSRTELAADLDVSPEKIVEILRHRVAPASFSQPLRHDSDAELGDLLEDHDAVSPFEAAAKALLSGEVAGMLANLNERELEVIHLRFGFDSGEPRTLEEVGHRFGLTRERIRQIEARAITKLRQTKAGTP